MTHATLAALEAAHGVTVDDHLDREDIVPLVTGPQAQGDLIVLPTSQVKPSPTDEAKPVPANGVPVLRGEAMGNTHLLLAGSEGVTWAASTATQDLGVVSVPEGGSAYLAHPEHGYSGIGAGTYLIRRQREQADEIRMVQD